MASVVALAPYSNLVFLEHLIKAIAARVAGAFSAAPKVEKMVTLVHQVKGIREMGCTTYSREKDFKVVGNRVRKMGKSVESNVSTIRASG